MIRLNTLTWEYKCPTVHTGILSPSSRQFPHTLQHVIGVHVLFLQFIPFPHFLNAHHRCRGRQINTESYHSTHNWLCRQCSLVIFRQESDIRSRYRLVNTTTCVLSASRSSICLVLVGRRAIFCFHLLLLSDEILFMCVKSLSKASNFVFEEETTKIKPRSLVGFGSQIRQYSAGLGLKGTGNDWV